MIEISSVKLLSVSIDLEKYKVTGKYELVSPKGNTIAVQNFNDYGCMVIEFNPDIARNLFSDIEAAIELQLGIQEAVKKMKS